MFRVITAFLAFALVFGGLHAATEVEPVANQNSSHELLTAVHSHTAPADPGTGQVLHSCHCAAHTPAVIATFDWPVVVQVQAPAPTLHAFRDAGRLPPPLRPPNFS